MAYLCLGWNGVTMKKRMKITPGGMIIGALLLLMAFICLVPYYYVIVTSFSDSRLIFEGELILFPRGFTLKSYEHLMNNQRFWECFRVTVLRTLLGTAFNLVFQCVFAYPLSRRYLPGRKFFMMFIVVTMVFNGGIIPTYIVVKETGLIDSIWALIIPNLISTWNVIILRSFFENLPASMEESAKMDGANDFVVFLRIMLPLSMPVLSTIPLFAAVPHWNSFMDAVIYLTSYQLQVLQVFLRDMVLQLEMASFFGDMIMPDQVSSLSLRNASIFLASIPIIVVYPFLQRFFVKGVMVGAVKG